MEGVLGLLKVRVLRGINLAIRDTTSSDAYVVLKLANQKLKTRVIKKNINPQWNEDLTLYVADPSLPIRLRVYDKDLFSQDDKMGDAEIEIGPFVEAVRIQTESTRNGTVLGNMRPNRQNCLAEDSSIIVKDGKVIQDMILRLRNVECGEVQLQLQWVSIPGGIGL
ncbi:putative ADP-ribosylation factor GTPase-activating protein AGD11 [Acorus calamus]|uniref:ADP-ribosylation factor GTPase-activating protein AGD11 n=1 Tax=Acorus calamus TaxID=4465 RepID=A0AAV9EW10_ACOCL|nr:putative ADP-ribosylation factor GTPase-activating protein AGD11 [Acorus calamus]